jgi:uncharacterized membrane protein
MQTTKPWWQSKTIWINVLTLMVTLIAQLMGWEELKAYTPELLIASNAINLVLRFISTAAIE